ncbi:hypothetical protein P0L94_00410 [Microbacter sp. GSS18]|nr:hypothetical protein P0L94_00410 [Microbacter sp. GSS18]
MDIQFVAGFGPITRGTADDALAFWSHSFGIGFEEVGPGYFHSHDLPGTKAFALWPLAQAAEATFGTQQWPADRPVPQAWLEFELASPDAVAAGAEELRAQGHEILVDAHEEPWGQTTARLQSPEGLLVGLSYLPSFHADHA